MILVEPGPHLAYQVLCTVGTYIVVSMYDFFTDDGLKTA